MHDIKLLSTRPLPENIVDIAAANGIGIDTHSFIKTEPIENVEVQQEIEHVLTLLASVVFTSMNAADALARFVLKQQPGWKIYCIGNTTKLLVEKHFGKQSIAGYADNATALAEIIVADKPGEIIFFCGSQRRDELPEILRSNNIKVNEIIVYETIALPQKVKNNYHGILFFSPSAVTSFFSVNKLNPTTVLFAIGSSTENEIRKYAPNKIVVGDKPGKENLTERAIEYFS